MDHGHGAPAAEQQHLDRRHGAQHRLQAREVEFVDGGGWPGCRAVGQHQNGAAVGFAGDAEAAVAVALDDLASLRNERRDVHLRSLLECAPSRSEEHTSELQSLMRISYAVFCLKTNN